MADDPVEAAIAHALLRSGYSFTRPKAGVKLDFHLPEFGVYIECCQFYTPRKIEQLSRHEDVILIQGRGAARAFSIMVE